MSRRLGRAIVEGKVEVVNRSSGEVAVQLIMPDGSKGMVRLKPGQTEELAPKHTTPQLMKRSPNLKQLLEKRTLTIV